MRLGGNRNMLPQPEEGSMLMRTDEPSLILQASPFLIVGMVCRIARQTIDIPDCCQVGKQIHSMILCGQMYL